MKRVKHWCILLLTVKCGGEQEQERHTLVFMGFKCLRSSGAVNKLERVGQKEVRRRADVREK